MKTFILQTLACITLALSLTAAVPADTNQWQSLFNGRDLTGWVKVNAGAYAATNGVLHLEQGKGWLCTRKQYTNFVFEAEWRGLETNFNSGIFVRAGTEGEPFPQHVWQVNLKQSAVGELLQGDRKVVMSVTPPPAVGEWVKFRLEARGKLLTLFVNGAQAWQFGGLEPASGYIGLQAEGRSVDFRNLRVQPLP